MPRHWPAMTISGALTLLLAGCTTPAARYDALAAESGVRRDEIVVDGLTHVVYTRGDPSTAPELDVYLEGDGTPWVDGRHVARDPTSRTALALLLMAGAKRPAILLGRPCYHGKTQEPACDPLLWTDARYSETVVASMAAALDRLRPEGKPLILVGHSGGGTLAMLLAERVGKVRGVVTIGANLDVGAWAEHHHFHPLQGSLDPSTRPPLPAHIRQLHLTGSNDRDVPSALVAKGASRQPGATVQQLAGFDHACCWLDVWPEPLERVAASPTLARGNSDETLH